MSGGGRRQELITRWIEPHPRKGGLAEALVRDSSVPGWAIIGQLDGEAGDVAAAAAYDLPLEAVEAALAYYQQHRGAIDDRLAANESPCRGVVPA